MKQQKNILSEHRLPTYLTLLLHIFKEQWRGPSPSSSSILYRHQYMLVIQQYHIAVSQARPFT